MTVAAVIVWIWIHWEISGEWIDPGAQSEADATSDGTRVGLLQANQIADDDIGTRNSPNAWHHRGLRLAVNELVDLDRLHRGADGDFSHDCACVRRATERVGKLFRNKKSAPCDA